MNILTENRVLVLDKSWRVVDEKTVAGAFSMMAADAATALDNSDGCFVPTKIDDWLKLPVREIDGVLEDSIGTSRGRVRIPRVIIAVNYKDAAKDHPRVETLTMKTLRERDNDICQLTGKKLKPEDCSMEHIEPRSKGGKKDWGNIVLAHRDVNSKRGNKPYEAVGLRKPKPKPAPKKKPKALTIKNKHGFPEWDMFLPKV